MFEFVNERLINSATDSFSGRPKFETLGDSGFRIYRFGTFKVNDVVNKTIYKTKSSKPIRPIIEITVPTITVAEGEKPRNIRLMIDLRLRGSVNSEYSTYNSRVKSKPTNIYVEITPGMTSTQIAKAMYDYILDQDFLYDNLRFTASVNGAKITLTGETEFQYFHNVEVQEVKDWSIAALGTYHPVEPVWVKLASYDTATKKDGVEGFGTYWTMLKNVQIQNCNRTDVFSQDNDDTKLIPGATYTQYVLDYRVLRDSTGMGAVGQELVSITKHIMWVNDSIVSDFEAVLQDSGIIIDDVEVTVTGITVTPTTVTVAAGATSDLTITTTPSGGHYGTKSLDTRIATIKGKKITGVSAGSAKILVTTEDGKIATVDVTVTA